MKILICDDDETTISMVRFRLSLNGLSNVAIARNGLQALEKLREQAYDLVITDIHMPYHNGDEIVNLIRVEQMRNTPIIMLSSDWEEEIIALAKKIGVDKFIRKPLKANDLSNAVKHLLRL